MNPAGPHIQTIRGPVPAAELGTTMIHEHLMVDLRCYWSPSDDPDAAFLPLAIERQPGCIVERPWWLRPGGSRSPRSRYALPGRGEVILRMEAAGVCRTDYKVSKGLQSSREPRYPMLLGHEGAGVVEQVGPEVTRLKEGDRVAVGCRVPCGSCSMCRRNDPRRCNSSSPRAPLVSLASDGSKVEVPMGLGMYAERVGVDAGAAFLVSDGMPMTSASLASLLGCAVMTGTGAVFHTAKVWPGATTAVIGCGGIGLSTVQGARMANAAKVIAVDISNLKLEWALSMGATHAVNSAKEDAVEAVRVITGGQGVDFSFEAVGMSATLEQALAMLSYGGVATLIGVPGPGSQARTRSGGLFPQHLDADDHSRRGRNTSPGLSGTRFPLSIGQSRSRRHGHPHHPSLGDGEGLREPGDRGGDPHGGRPRLTLPPAT